MLAGAGKIEDDTPDPALAGGHSGLAGESSGGAWGRRTTIIGSASSGPAKCSCGPAGRTMITSTPWPNGASWARRWWPRPGCCWAWGSSRPGPVVRGKPEGSRGRKEQQQIRLRAGRVGRVGGHSGALGGGFQHAHPGQRDSGDHADGVVEQSSALRHRAVLGHGEDLGQGALPAWWCWPAWFTLGSKAGVARTNMSG